jgi:hypothetical protein
MRSGQVNRWTMALVRWAWPSLKALALRGWPWAAPKAWAYLGWVTPWVWACPDWPKAIPLEMPTLSAWGFPDWPKAIPLEMPTLSA